MNYKELMIKSLTNLLEDGETLNHPIYGILNQGNTQYYGFFGFAENYLLVALVSGKEITYTLRIPLDIKSIKIKKTLVFRQYVIDIGFNNGAPCRITASPKVLMIDTQKENLPLFLNYLKSKSPKNQTVELKDIDGDKIRRQCFNTFIYMMLTFFPMQVVIIGLKENNLDFSELIEVATTGFIILGVFLIPFIVLSLINRFFFGKIVSVVNNDGLFLENDHILWKDIQKITYHPRLSSTYKASYTYATILVKPLNKQEYTIDIMHFPLYGLRKIKKYISEIKISLDKNDLLFILLIALAPTVISIIISFIM